MNTRFKVGFALVAMTTALMMSGCSTASSDVSTTSDCQGATSYLETANSALSSAQANLNAVLKDDNKVGTRYEDDARAAVEDAQNEQKSAQDTKNASCADTSNGSTVASALFTPADTCFAALNRGDTAAIDALCKTQDGLTADQAAEVQQDLFVDPAKVATDYCASLVQKYGLTTVKIAGTNQVTPVFFAGVTQGISGTNTPLKLWSDAVNVPLDPQNLTLEAEQAVICHDPAQAAMVMNRLGAVKIGDKTIGEVNSDWIKAQGDLTEIKSWADSCMTNNVETHLQCAKTMSLTAVLLNKFADSGVKQVATTTWNVYLPNGAVVGSIPEYGLNPVQEENGHWLVLDYTSKTGEFCLQFGFNVGNAQSGVNGGDQRIAQLSCGTPPGTPPTTPPGTPPTTPPGTPPTTPPGTPPTTPPTTPPSGKHASEAPTSDAPIVPAPPGGYVDRTGTTHTEPYVPPASTVPPAEVGQGDSGSGATNTVPPPATSSPPAEVPVTTAPTTPPPAMP